jgi:hypothetical protein
MVWVIGSGCSVHGKWAAFSIKRKLRAGKQAGQLRPKLRRRRDIIRAA